ncbi:MAG: hypothetical protein GY694_10215 [Gammaproteobacteria bacterium]|nr:hypothetical protein [Gammaproteobacteria bacterium]
MLLKELFCQWVKFSEITLITTSTSDGPNGLLLNSVTETLPDAPIIHRQGQIAMRKRKKKLSEKFRNLVKRNRANAN